MQIEGGWLWAALVAGASAGAFAFALDENWTGFSLCAAAAVVAVTQLGRILLRRKMRDGGGGRGGRRW